MLLAELPESQHDPDDVRDLAGEILSRPEYREQGESLLERIDRFLAELMESLLSSFGIAVSGGVASVVAWVTLLLLIAVVVALAVWAWRGGGWARRRHEPRPTAILATESGRNAADWAVEAEQHESEGRWREGMLCRYRALVTELVERGVLTDAAGRTAGEYVREVAHRVALGDKVAGSFAAATELFEAVYYGGAEAGPSQRDRFARRASATLASLPASSAAGDTAQAAPRRADALMGPR